MQTAERLCYVSTAKTSLVTNTASATSKLTMACLFSFNRQQHKSDAAGTDCQKSQKPAPMESTTQSCRQSCRESSSFHFHTYCQLRDSDSDTQTMFCSKILFTFHSVFKTISNALKCQVKTLPLLFACHDPCKAVHL